MLTHEINRYPEYNQAAITNRKKPKFIHGSTEHREFLYNRLLESVLNDPIYQPGNHVYIGNKRRKFEGQILRIVEKFDEVEWVDLKCCLIEVWVYADAEVSLYHPSELTLKRRSST